MIFGPCKLKFVLCIFYLCFLLTSICILLFSSLLITDFLAVSTSQLQRDIILLLLLLIFNLCDLFVGLEQLLFVDQFGWICWPVQCHCSKIPQGGCCKSKFLKHVKKLISCSFWITMNISDFVSDTLHLVAAILFWNISINLSFTFIRKVESLCTKPQIRIYHILHSHSQPNCRYCWNDGMTWIL